MKNISVTREDKYNVHESYKGPIQDYTGTPKTSLELEHLSLTPNELVLLLFLYLGKWYEKSSLWCVWNEEGRPSFIGGEEGIFHGIFS